MMIAGVCVCVVWQLMGKPIHDKMVKKAWTETRGQLDAL